MEYNHIIFEGDPKKSLKNFYTHSITFDEAQTVWLDLMSLEFKDEYHSDTEDRFYRLGRSIKNRILIIVYCERNHGDIIRLISARKATPAERKIYEE